MYKNVPGTLGDNESRHVYRWLINSLSTLAVCYFVIVFFKKQNWIHLWSANGHFVKTFALQQQTKQSDRNLMYHIVQTLSVSVVRI